MCSTIHSCEENLQDGIPISERPLNEFNLQLILQESTENPTTAVEIIFKNRQRRTIQKQVFYEGTIIDIFKKFLAPNKLHTILTNDDTFKIVQSVFSAYFAHSKVFRPYYTLQRNSKGHQRHR